MSPLHLQPHEQLLVSSDVRAFFYIFKVPVNWHPFLALNRPLPPELCGDKQGRWYPCSAVLPMGFKNSVSIAQHVHRFVVKQAMVVSSRQGSEAELRKDRPFSSSNPVHRIYLDNFDQLEKVDAEMADSVRGKASTLIRDLQETYASHEFPRHPKKAVWRQLKAEVQGAIVDVEIGIAYPKVKKVMRYVHLARLLLEEGRSSQKQMQIVGGGFDCLYGNVSQAFARKFEPHIWQFIVDCEGYPPVVKFDLPPKVIKELSRFLGLIPLAYMDFRCQVSHVVSASDASESGGGVTASEQLTSCGSDCKLLHVRGDVVEPTELGGVLTIGLFDGIGALRVAADALGWNVVGHISVEAGRVVESRFPGSVLVSDVNLVDFEMVKSWSQRFTQVSLIVAGAGPPCQGVSGLNAARKGALKDERSCSFSHVDRIKNLVRRCFPWAQVQGLMESVASMDAADGQVMGESFGAVVYRCLWGFLGASSTLVLVGLGDQSVSRSLLWPNSHRAITSIAASRTRQDIVPFSRVDSSERGSFPDFHNQSTQGYPGHKPAGIKQCQAHEVARWQTDQHRFPPYNTRTNTV
eukprot:s849_g13.t1